MKDNYQNFSNGSEPKDSSITIINDKETQHVLRLKDEITSKCLTNQSINQRLINHGSNYQHWFRWRHHHKMCEGSIVVKMFRETGEHVDDSLCDSAVLHDGRKRAGRIGRPGRGLSPESRLSILLRHRYLQPTHTQVFILSDTVTLTSDVFYLGDIPLSEESGTMSQHNRGYECSMVSAAVMEHNQPPVSHSLSYTCTTFKPPALSETPGPESPAC